MVKNTDLWDDSALINAFNQSISNYKKMHSKGYEENTIINTIDETDVKSSCFDVVTSFDESVDNSSNPDQRDYDDSNAIPEGVERETPETNKLLEVIDREVPQEHPNNSTSQDMDEYNQLYKQYYEIEDQRQKILQKMQNFSNWNYSYPNETHGLGLEWAPNLTTQGYHQSSTSQAHGSMVVSCCPCACQCSKASSNNLCVDSLAMKDTGKNPGVVDDDVVKMAMGAAERAICTLRDSKENNASEQNVTSGGTDLTTVLNAWYSAGFYTGKYLTEQSLAKKQQE